MPTKTKIIISDTHIGAGGVQYGNKLEDFISDQEFYHWVHELIEESVFNDLEMDMIINGDWIEFLQVPDAITFDPAKIYATDAYTSLTPEAALQRLEIVHAGHPLVFQALADFISPGPPCRTLTILYGNHDPELAYPAVQKRLCELLGACGYKQDLLTVGKRSYFKDGVYVEHGNAYTEKFNQFTDPDAPFDTHKPHLIERPPGSYVVTDYYNQIERERPWIDGVHPMIALLFYALAFDPVFAMQALTAFLQAIPDLLSDVTLSASEKTQSDALLALLEKEDAQVLAERLISSPAFATDFIDMMQQSLIARGALPASSSSPENMTVETLSSHTALLQARQISEYYWQVLEEAAAVMAASLDARAVLFGHIHEQVIKPLPSGAVYLNTGTWTWKANFTESPEEVWRDLMAHPEKYMNQRQLTYARVDVDANTGVTSARLLQANDPPAPPAPPDPMPQPGLWARFVMAVRKIIAALTNWL